MPGFWSDLEGRKNKPLRTWGFVAVGLQDSVVNQGIGVAFSTLVV